jgi:hypothetical protein
MNASFMKAFKFTMEITAIIAFSATIITALRGRENLRQRR